MLHLFVFLEYFIQNSQFCYQDQLEQLKIHVVSVLLILPLALSGIFWSINFVGRNILKDFMGANLNKLRFNYYFFQ